MKRITPHFSTNFHRHSNGYIQLIMTLSDGRLFYSIGHSISEKTWIIAKRAKDKYLNHLPGDIKARILDIESWVAEFTNGKEEVYKSDLKIFLNDKIKGKHLSGNKGGFFEIIAGKLQDMQDGVLLNKGKAYAPLTIKNLESSLNVLRKYNPNLTFGMNGEDVLGEFLSWCNIEGMGLPYADRIIKDWKKFHKLCGKKLEFKRLDRKDVESKKVYLNLKELEILEKAPIKELAEAYNEQLPKEEHILITDADIEIRDRFIINCFTGLRISDMKELTISRIVEGKIYFESTQKTKKRVVIPILPPVQRIIDKYNGELPYQYHDVTVNRRIKVIASLAGITKKEEIKISELPVFIRENLKALILDRKIERLKETVLIPKNELITNHTARRSFITNMLRKGISLDRVQGATGLSFATIERKYNKATAEELAGDWPQDLLKAI